MVDIFRPHNGKLKVGLFGLGKSNLGVLELLRSRLPEFELTVRADTPQSADVAADRCFFGSRALESIDEDVLFLSPSVRRDKPELLDAQKRGTRRSSDAELFFSLKCSDVYAVTGSDGKSTTTYLISEMLTRSGIRAIPAGNFGRSLCTAAGTGSTVVAELSSFQLQYLTPTCRSAVITNITPNHLNWHTSLAEYTDAKMNIVKNAERVTVDYDSELLRAALPKIKLFCAVSLDLSYRELRRRCDAENYMTCSDSVVYLNGYPYFSIRDAMRRESYNVRNYMLSAASTLGASTPSAITETVGSFGGLTHRAERIATHQGITYINSSIDSTPDRTLKTLGALRGNTAVILCGIGKGLPLDELAMQLPRLTVGAVLMGDIGRELSALLNGTEYKFARAENMSDAIAIAESYLPYGGNLVLSPAGTSFDNYKNFEMRGEDFKALVLAHITNKKDKE